MASGDLSMSRMACVLLVALLTACTQATPTPASSPSPARLVDCQSVPEGLCRQYAGEAMAGPQPSGAGRIIHVLVTCERNPPCKGDRRDSGGRIVITYDDGGTFVQDW